jgi:uncharacterized repeat protein (TIGR03803 family)
LAVIGPFAAKEKTCMGIKTSAISMLLAASWLGASGLQSVAQSAAQTESIPGTTFTTVHSFSGADGTKSFAGLLQGKNGNLYGTTYYGGANNDGEIFQITTAGKLTVLHSFRGADGGYSYAAPVQGADGNFYGTTYLGGPKGDGTVFKMTPGGKLTTLHSFVGADGSQPLAGLAAGSDGNFYGTTNLGGSHGDGVVFKVTPSGQFTVLHNFCSKAACADGQNSYAGLIQATDGSLYGTTLAGGTQGHGTVFRITKGGALTTLYSFCSQSGCADGEFPQTGLLQASNGNLYGETILGGAYGSGTIFELTLSGALTTLYSACSQSNCPDGNYLYAPLVQAKDGNLYGIMQIGGANNSGTVFQITLSGALTTLYSFCSQAACADGQYPAAGLVQATNGNLYGTTADGGADGDGTVFRIAP